MGGYKIVDDNARVPLTNSQNKKSCGTRLQRLCENSFINKPRNRAFTLRIIYN